ncbi:hypothetical protein DEO48_25580 [Enterobacter sp. CGMCC 5087]|uniref:hypothetical protein n=1 Tax=Enterobacter sp. CGMCC 5087 TaxID=2183878 RepID=UPI000D678E0D|nr:hypothetical protein [Enterobacter sp. CGMCC 5087]PWI77203.1 hypothetical protein DEO48_25580 [Enterobacter sp. CGMCC 5087]
MKTAEEGGMSVAVVDPCALGRFGLERALCSLSGVADVRAVADLAALLLATGGADVSPGAPDVLVIRLPPDARAALVLLLRLCGHPVCLMPVRRLLILSPFVGAGVSTLLAGVGRPVPVCIASSRLSVCELTACIRGSSPAPEGVVLFASDFSVRGYLSVSECQVLRLCLESVSLPIQAVRRCRSRKTLYAQRSAGLRKLGVTSLRDLLRMLTGQVPAVAGSRRCVSEGGK